MGMVVFTFLPNEFFNKIPIVVVAVLRPHDGRFEA
jgi:hypothetical protein